MHRMGATSTKMVEFSEFKMSVLENRTILEKLKSKSMARLSTSGYAEMLNSLDTAFKSLKVSKSKAMIVAHAKTLAHILPNLIPPIDRQYTIRFFTQDHSKFFGKDGKYTAVLIPENKDHQLEQFKDYALRIHRLHEKCSAKHLLKIDAAIFNTSVPKIMDNLIMCYVKSVPKPPVPVQNRADNSRKRGSQ